jgi:hypothetical protein
VTRLNKFAQVTGEWPFLNQNTKKPFDIFKQKINGCQLTTTGISSRHKKVPTFFKQKVKEVN